MHPHSVKHLKPLAKHAYAIQDEVIKHEIITTVNNSQFEI